MEAVILTTTIITSITTIIVLVLKYFDKQKMNIIHLDIRKNNEQLNEHMMSQSRNNFINDPFLR